LEYVEGLATNKLDFKFKHAWLLLDGAVLDLTLNMNEHSYITSHVVPLDELKVALHAMRRRREYGFINEKALDRLLILLARGPKAAARFDAASGYVGSDGSW